MDATCNGCDFTREVKEMITIYFPKDGKYVTGVEYKYTSSSGKVKMQLVLTTNKAEALPFEIIRNADGTVAFVAEGRYLMADGTNAELVSAPTENTLFVFEETDGGVFIRCATANFSGKPQYLEVYSGYLTCYGMGTDPSIYVFEIQNAEGANGKVQELGGSDSGSTEPSTPSTGATSIPNGVASVETGKNYKLAGVNSSGTLFFNGTVSSGRINGNATGVTVQLEAGAAAGEYYIYFMDGSTKTYIAIDDGDDSSSFVFSTTKDDSCVWVIDASAKTIVSKANSKRGMATQNTSTYSNFSTYAVSNFGTDPIYVPCWFVAA